MHTPVFPRNASPLQEISFCRKVGEKGRGLFATRNLSRGTCILKAEIKTGFLKILLIKTKKILLTILVII